MGDDQAPPVPADDARVRIGGVLIDANGLDLLAGNEFGLCRS
jgi:hypothetical protein